jgi:hypothetical protein
VLKSDEYPDLITAATLTSTKKGSKPASGKSEELGENMDYDAYLNLENVETDCKLEIRYKKVKKGKKK